MKAFKTMSELHGWLVEKGVNTASWGQGASKNLHNLWQEYCAGEVVFQDEHPLRILSAVQVIIQRNGRYLIEAEQEFMNGQRRARFQPPSEKMKPGESVTEAALRCLQEELSVLPESVQLLPPAEKEMIVTQSLSYPGLTTGYLFYKIAAVVPCLPDVGFWRDNVRASESDPVKRHYWVWDRRKPTLEQPDN